MSGLSIRVDVGRLIASSLVVLATYAVLIETWRRALAVWGAHVSFADAARIWNVSNLGKYVPGKVWQISAMAVMMQRIGVPLAASGAAALVLTIANVVVGFALVLALGARTLSAVPGGVVGVGALVAVAAAGLAAAPLLVPRLARAVGRLLGRDLSRLTVPFAAVWRSALGCLIAWLLYGVAFRLFTSAVLGEAPGGLLPYVVAYTGSYLLGYLALLFPGGIGVRELALTSALPALGLMSPPAAALVTVWSRLWLTVLELVPGLLYLAAGARSRRE